MSIYYKSPVGWLLWSSAIAICARDPREYHRNGGSSGPAIANTKTDGAVSACSHDLCSLKSFVKSHNWFCAPENTSQKNRWVYRVGTAPYKRISCVFGGVKTSYNNLIYLYMTLKTKQKIWLIIITNGLNTGRAYSYNLYVMNGCILLWVSLNVIPIRETWYALDDRIHTARMLVKHEYDGFQVRISLKSN